MSYFFESFPKVKYDIDKSGREINVTNLLLRYQFRNFSLYKDRSTVFYDHVVEEGERPDITADTFYGDSTLKNLLVHSKNVAEECKQFQSFLTGNEDDEDA